jgi:putative tricarboxylic transport membrane protein
MDRIKGPKNLFAGLVFLGIAVIFGISASQLALGSAARMGPGYFPMLVSGALGLLGIVVMLEGFLREDEHPEGFSLRGIVFVAASVLAFAGAIQPLGLVPAVALTSFLLSLADRDFRLVPSLAAAVALALFSWAVFSYALSLPWPAFGYLFR